ncbi:MAG: GspH/FimT family pseudopilin [Vicinamibacterales bacterium]|nr:GspH/FimT family pseudopilin [Vicinamibacterales bacterium]
MKAELGPLAGRGGTAGNARPANLYRSASGFTVTELVATAGIIATMAAMATMVMPGALTSARADGGSARLISELRVAREQAITQRRTVQVLFTAPNRLVVRRVEVPGPGTTVLSDIVLEEGMTFLLFSGVPDTPDAFGRASATSFGTATRMAFTSEGSFVDQNGDPVNGTVFLGRPNQPTSARAITVFGPTALVRNWRWNGSGWTR